METIKSQRTIFRTCIGDLAGTIDWTAVSTKRNNIKFLPAGTPVGNTTAGDVLTNRELLLKPLNDAKATGVLKHDVYEGQDVVAFMYNGEVISEEIDRACQEVFTADASATVKTALKNITFVSNGHISS